VEDPAHPAEALHALLTLVRGWIVAGAPRIETPMRSFTPWASATAGFLDWMGEKGFLTNRAELAMVDEEETTYGAFYQRWYELLGEKRLTATQLRDTAFPDDKGDTRYDWRGTFLTRRSDGVIPSAKGLGMMLRAERGRYRGGFRLEGHYDDHKKVWAWSVGPEVVPAGTS
jgi:hypothetical protein